MNKDAVNVEDDEIMAKYFNNIAKSTARRYAREGKLGVPAYQPIKKNGYPWFIKLADLERVFGKS